jgi:hypothetical protein
MATAPSERIKGEPLSEPPKHAVPVEAVRGTLLLIDWRWLRENALFDAYRSALGPGDALLATTASEWVPFPAAMAHWRALDSLQLSPSREHEIGKFLGEHVHHIVLGTLVRLAGQVGVSPWVALGQCGKLWQRSWRGGALTAYRQGPTTARLELLNAPVVASHAFRHGVTGTVLAGIAPFCTRPIVTERSEERTSTSIVLRASWQA